jgi:hypothetical protein
LPQGEVPAPPQAPVAPAAVLPYAPAAARPAATAIPVPDSPVLPEGVVSVGTNRSEEAAGADLANLTTEQLGGSVGKDEPASVAVEPDAPPDAVLAEAVVELDTRSANQEDKIDILGAEITRLRQEIDEVKASGDSETPAGSDAIPVEPRVSEVGPLEDSLRVGAASEGHDDGEDGVTGPSSPKSPAGSDAIPVEPRASEGRPVGDARRVDDSSEGHDDGEDGVTGPSRTK